MKRFLFLRALALVLPSLLAQATNTQHHQAAFTRGAFDRVIMTESDYPNPEKAALPDGFAIGRPAPASFLQMPDDLTDEEVFKRFKTQFLFEAPAITFPGVCIYRTPKQGILVLTFSW